MHTYDLKDAQGRVFAFEVSNSRLGRRRAVRVVSELPNVRVRRSPRWLSWFCEEEFCEFEIDGRVFVMAEPWGDSSRYWIGPKPAHWCEEVSFVREAFQRIRPSRLSA